MKNFKKLTAAVICLFLGALLIVSATEAQSRKSAKRKAQPTPTPKLAEPVPVPEFEDPPPPPPPLPKDFLALPDRESVTAEETTGTFRMNFAAEEFKTSFNEIKILALGKGKLKIAFDLVYPFTTPDGKTSANVGKIQGEAPIYTDTAYFASYKKDGSNCYIAIKFLENKEIAVIQQEDLKGCGFGLNVSAKGTYKKVSDGAPQFADK